MTAYNADPATKSFLGSLENIGNVAPCRSRLATFSAVLRNEQGLDLLRTFACRSPLVQHMGTHLQVYSMQAPC